MSRYVVKSLKKFRTNVLNYFFNSYGGGALGVNLSCSGSRFNETIIGQQNTFSVGALEASFRKVDSNAADAIPILPFSRPF